MHSRRLAAVMIADVVGYSRLMEADEEGTAQLWTQARDERIYPIVGHHGGRLVKGTGDGFVAEFPSPVEAIRCALAVQFRDPEDERRMQLRLGIDLGDILLDQDGDIYGETVNIAARLEAIADPGGISVSGKVYDEVQGRVRLS